MWDDSSDMGSESTDDMIHEKLVVGRLQGNWMANGEAIMVRAQDFFSFGT